MKDEGIERLVKLVNAVWHRLQQGQFDTTAFEESDLKARVAALELNKKQRRTALQRAYEQWLIEQDEK